MEPVKGRKPIETSSHDRQKNSRQAPADREETEQPGTVEMSGHSPGHSQRSFRFDCASQRNCPGVP